VVCAQAKMPPGAPVWQHDVWGFVLALIAFALVFGAFAANTLHGAMAAVPGADGNRRSLWHDPRQAFRRVMLPQMWVYALPGLSNLWMILTKATPLLFLLGIQDIVYWARELGGAKTSLFAYPHPDWRVWYFLGVLCFYLLLTWGSQKVFDRLMVRLSRGRPPRRRSPAQRPPA
jgi:polar amino acid transport system permease protein